MPEISRLILPTKYLKIKKHTKEICIWYIWTVSVKEKITIMKYDLHACLPHQFVPHAPKKSVEDPIHIKWSAPQDDGTIFESIFECVFVYVYLCICLSVYLCICVSVYLCICVFVYFCGGADSYQVECSPAGMGLDGTISIEMKLQKLNSGSESGVQ